MEALIKDIFNFLLQYYALYLVIVMGIITTLIITILKYAKIPFKKLTAKISNDRLRKFVNRLVIFIASFGISFALWLLLNLIAPEYFALDYKEIILNGALPIVAYAFAEGWITVDKAKELISNAVEIGADGKITKEEVKKTANDLNNALNAEQELQKLLKK